MTPRPSGNPGGDPGSGARIEPRLDRRAGTAAAPGLSEYGPIVEPDSPAKTPWDGASIPFPASGVGEEVATETADPVAAPAKEDFPPRKKAAFTPARLGAFLSSTVIHVLLLSFGAGALVAAGIEPPEDPVSVEIVLEAPAKPAPPVQPAQASAAAAHNPPPPEVETASPAPEKDETPPETAKDEAVEADTAAPAEQKTADQPPKAETEAETTPPPEEAVAVPAPDKSTLSILSVPPSVPAPPVSTPVAPALPAAAQDAAEKPNAEPKVVREPEEKRQEPAVTPVPHPTPRPAIQKTQEKKVPSGKTSTEKPERRRAKARPEKERDRKTGRAHNGAPRARQPAASPGVKAAYARKLLAHVQRYKRYPAAAERAGITGAARLSITIDRHGSLRGARLVSSAGSALLDKEAMSVAQRAAPYPPPPSGIGKATFSFIVTLRFTR